jgi:hypothetical protein
MAFVLLEGFVGMGGMTDFGRAHGTAVLRPPGCRTTTHLVVVLLKQGAGSFGLCSCSIRYGSQCSVTARTVRLVLLARYWPRRLIVSRDGREETVHTGILEKKLSDLSQRTFPVASFLGNPGLV